MKKNKSIVWNISVSIFFALLIATFAFSIYKFTRHADPTELFIFSAKNYAADKPVSIIFHVRNAAKQTPLKNQDIELSVNGKPITSIKTQDDGTALLVLKEYPKKGFTIQAKIGECIVEKRINLAQIDKHKLISHQAIKMTHNSKIQLQTDKSFYAPDETIKGIIKSKLTAKTKIEIKVSLTFRVIEPITKNDDSMFGAPERDYIRKQVNYKKIRAVTDSNGSLKFQLKLPREFSKINFEEEDSICELSIQTLDDSLTKRITITKRPIRIKYLSVFSGFVPGCPRDIYFFISDPAGKPLIATVAITGIRAKTDKNGIALLEMPLTVSESTSFYVNAIVASGEEATDTIKLEYDNHPGKFILKTDKLIYNFSDRMLLNIISVPSNERVFIDIAKDSKSWTIFPLELSDNKAPHVFEIPDGLLGLIQINAYRFLPNGKIVHDLRIVQVDKAGEKSCFASTAQMIRAKFESPVNVEFENAKRLCSSKLEIKKSSSYESRNEIFTKQKNIYGKKLFSILLPVLFGVFLTLLIWFISLWFSPSWSDYALIIPQNLYNKTRNNIFIAIPLYFILTFAFGGAFGTMMEIECGEVLQAGMFLKYVIIIVSSVAYVLILFVMLWRSSHVRNLLLQVPSDKGGDGIKKSVFLLPYLLIIFIVFEHSWIVSLNYCKNIEWLTLLIWAFHGLVVIWLFCAYGIRKFYYTENEYNSMLKYGSRHETKLGAGLGANQSSFWKTWFWGGMIFWGIPVFIYIFVVIIIISMFLPLAAIIEKLG